LVELESVHGGNSMIGACRPESGAPDTNAARKSYLPSSDVVNPLRKCVARLVTDDHDGKPMRCSGI
jgi:hypothetical protein